MNDLHRIALRERSIEVQRARAGAELQRAVGLHKRQQEIAKARSGQFTQIVQATKLAMSSKRTPQEVHWVSHTNLPHEQRVALEVETAQGALRASGAHCDALTQEQTTLHQLSARIGEVRAARLALIAEGRELGELSELCDAKVASAVALSGPGSIGIPHLSVAGAGEQSSPVTAPRHTSPNSGTVVTHHHSGAVTVACTLEQRRADPLQLEFVHEAGEALRVTVRGAGRVERSRLMGLRGELRARLRELGYEEAQIELV